MTNRDEQIHEAFERQQAEEYEIPYEELKERFDRNEGLYSSRYVPGSTRQVKFLKFKIQWLEKELDEALKIEWSEESEGTEKIRYNHIIGKSCLGNFVIWWKGWKDRDCPGVQLGDDDFIGEAKNIEDAKKLAQDYLQKRLKNEIKTHHVPSV